MKKPILQVEDSEDDARLLQLAFQKAGIINEIITIHSGDEAICYLKGEGAYADRATFPMPGVLLLDLKLPGTSGFEVLEWIKQQSSPPDTLLVAISGYSEMHNVNRAYKLGARSFLTKPINPEDIVNLTKAFGGYWSFKTPG